MAYSLYVIELSREALGESRFATRNPDPREDKPCVYVGQTGLSPEERFTQHKAGYKSNLELPRLRRQFSASNASPS